LATQIREEAKGTTQIRAKEADNNADRRKGVTRNVESSERRPEERSYRKRRIIRTQT